MGRTPGFIELADGTRAQFGGALAEAELTELARNPDLQVLQCSGPVPASTWSLLNAVFFARRPDVELRIYGYETCNLDVVRRMTNVRRFAADCLMTARNVHAIAEIPHLESLSLGIFDLRDFRVLENVSPHIEKLSLAATRSKAPSLAPLRRFRSLKTLYLEGHAKDIDVLGDLPGLEDITLRSITTPDLGYLAPLTRLWSVDIKLGGIRSFAGIEGKESIKYLELWQIRELHDIGIAAALPGLQNLFLQSLPHIRSFPSLTAARKLRRVVIENLKSLGDFSAFERAPALEEFGLVDGARQTPEQLAPVLRNPNVRRVSAGFGSDAKNNSFARLRDEFGKIEANLWEPFQYS